MAENNASLPGTLHLSPGAWETFQRGLYERDERLEQRQPGQSYRPDEKVDAFVLSAHAEALYSQDIDPELWDTLADLDLEAGSDDEAWGLIKDFYLERGNVLVVVGDGAGEEREEWIFSEALAERLGLSALAGG